MSILVFWGKIFKMFLLLHFEVEGHQTHTYGWPLTSLQKLWVKKLIQGHMSILVFLIFLIFQYYYILKFNVGHLGMLEALMYVTFDLLID